MTSVAHEPDPSATKGPRSTGNRVSGVALGLLAGALVLFAALAVTASQRVTQGWDRAAFGAIYSGEALPGYRDSSPGEGALDAVLPVGWRLADTRVLAACCAALLLVALRFHGARGVAFVAIAIAPMAPLSRLLEQGFGRESPYPDVGVGAFPSGHAMVSAAIAFTAIALGRSGTGRRLAVAGGAAFMLAIGVSVIADGGHWPSDVLGGWLFAAIWVTGAYALVMRPHRSRTPPTEPAAMQHSDPPSRPTTQADRAAPRAHAP